eukprot:COSAG01_NODE_9283_length_2495_cov_1.633973_1_plen_132_part_00
MDAGKSENSDMGPCGARRECRLCVGKLEVGGYSPIAGQTSNVQLVAFGGTPGDQWTQPPLPCLFGEPEPDASNQPWYPNRSLPLRVLGSTTFTAGASRPAPARSTQQPAIWRRCFASISLRGVLRARPEFG